MRGLPVLAREIYVFGIRPFMDYSTGMVGIKRGISWKSIAEELYVDPHQGIKGGEASEKELRRALVWLQKAGLIGPNQAERRLVFELLLATRDQSARNKVGSKWADEVGSYVEGSQPSNDADSTEEEGRKAGGSELPKVGTPPLSGNNNTAHNAREAQADPGQRFPMTDDWEPGRESFGAVLHRNGLANQVFQADQLLEFRSYWISRPETERTQGQWEHALAQQLKRQYRLNQSAEDNANETRGRFARSRARSAYDVLSNPEW